MVTVITALFAFIIVAYVWAEWDDSPYDDDDEDDYRNLSGGLTW